MDRYPYRVLTTYILQKCKDEVAKALFAYYSPQSKFAGSASSIFFGYGRFKLSIIVMNSSSDFVSRGFKVRSSNIELGENRSTVTGKYDEATCE